MILCFHFDNYNYNHAPFDNYTTLSARSHAYEGINTYAWQYKRIGIMKNHCLVDIIHLS